MMHACASTSTFELRGTTRVPRLHGTVRVERMEAESRLLTFKIRDLPPPDHFFTVAPGGVAPRYVVWLVVAADQHHKVGALAYHAPTRTGNIMATTQERQFRLLVTSESNPSTLQPGPYVVVDQSVSLR
jgi:hypothetical protein